MIILLYSNDQIRCASCIRTSDRVRVGGGVMGSGSCTRICAFLMILVSSGYKGKAANIQVLAVLVLLLKNLLYVNHFFKAV